MDITVISGYGGGNRITAVASDGEIFEGEVVSDSVETERFSDSIEDLFGARSNSTKYKYSTSGSTKYSSNSYGVLVGSKGHSMKCELSLTSPKSGMAVGGIGECHISDGRIVPVTMSRQSRF